MPASFTAAAKFWVGLLGALVSSLVATLAPDTPGYKALVVLSTLLTAAAVYLVPNEDPAPTATDNDAEG